MSELHKIIRERSMQENNHILYISFKLMVKFQKQHNYANLNKQQIARNKSYEMCSIFTLKATNHYWEQLKMAYIKTYVSSKLCNFHINIIKSVPFNLFYRFKAITTKISKFIFSFFAETDRLTQKLTWNAKAKNNLVNPWEP